MKHINIKSHLPLLLILWMFSVACSDDAMDELEADLGEETIEEEPDEVSDDLFYQLIRIENLGADTIASDNNPTLPKPTMYFSLEQGGEVASDLAKTNRWDLAFGNLYNSFLSGNNGEDPQNYGSGANGVGGILILAENFDDVVTIPSDDQFLTGRDLIGTDTTGAFGVGLGWYLYDFGGGIMGDGSYEKRHVAYALPDTRTVVVRTGRGHYAKIRMISVYRDAFTPEEWFRDTPHMYFTFEYIMVPEGSETFETRS